MEPLKSAIIGCGPRAAGHAKAAQDGGALELVYACDVDQERAGKAAADWGVRAATDAAQVLDDSSIDAVVIVTNVGTHVPLARMALEAGKHVIVEKPLGDDIADARALVDMAANTDRIVYVSYQLRFMAKMQAIRSVLPEIDPVQIFFGRSRAMMKPQFLNPSPFCGIMDVCAHDFDMISWFMGRPPEAVTAIVRRNTFTPDTDAADSATILIDYGDDRSAIAVSSIGAAEIGTKLDVAGACGNLSMAKNGDVTGVTFIRNDSMGEKTPIDFQALLTAQSADLKSNFTSMDIGLQHAFNCEVRTGTRSDAARLQDGLNSLLVTMASLISAKEGRRVELAELR